jgi:nucleotidyltransferase/DNA polymerase involved in DNA repair
MIAHADADAFFASVLQRLHPHLKGKPLIASGMGGGCAIAASYPAKAKGVKTGMRIKDALALCPEAIVMPSDFRETGLASQQIEAILKDVCPLVEEMSIDEWFLDLETLVGGTPEDAGLWARAIQDRIIRSTDIGVSIGVAPTKTLAKMAGEEKKPRGVTVLRTREEIDAFLKRRPAAAIPGIGRKREVDVRARGWETAHDIAYAPDSLLQGLFGIGVVELAAEMRGEQVYAVTMETAPPKSVSRARSFHPTDDSGILWAYVLQHLSYSVLKMRRHGLAAKGISIWLRNDTYDGGDDHGVKLPRAYDAELDLIPYARRCFQRARRSNKRYTQVALALWHLVPGGTVQYSLFTPPEQTDRVGSIQKSLDGLRTRYGKDIVVPGAAISITEQRRPGLVMTTID